MRSFICAFFCSIRFDTTEELSERCLRFVRTSRRPRSRDRGTIICYDRSARFVNNTPAALSLHLIIQEAQFLSNSRTLISLNFDVSIFDCSSSTAMLFQNSCDLFHCVRIMLQAAHNGDALPFASLGIEQDAHGFSPAVVSFFRRRRNRFRSLRFRK